METSTLPTRPLPDSVGFHIRADARHFLSRLHQRHPPSCKRPPQLHALAPSGTNISYNLRSDKSSGLCTPGSTSQFHIKPLHVEFARAHNPWTAYLYFRCPFAVSRQIRRTRSNPCRPDSPNHHSDDLLAREIRT
jgi:hypothetical protein